MANSSLFFSDFFTPEPLSLMGKKKKLTNWDKRISIEFSLEFAGCCLRRLCLWCIQIWLQLNPVQLGEFLGGPAAVVLLRHLCTGGTAVSCMCCDLAEVHSMSYTTVVLCQYLYLPSFTFHCHTFLALTASSPITMIFTSTGKTVFSLTVTVPNNLSGAPVLCVCQAVLGELKHLQSAVLHSARLLPALSKNGKQVCHFILRSFLFSLHTINPYRTGDNVFF